MAPLHTDHSTIGSVAALIAQALQKYECDPVPLFAESGIDIGSINDPQSRYPITHLQKLWKKSVEATGDPCFGLTAAQQFQPAALRGLGFAFLASDTLRDAFNRLIRFSRFLSTGVNIRLEETEAHVDLVITGPEKWPDFVYAAADMGMAIYLRMCQITVGNTIHPALVTLQRPKASCAKQFDRLFGAPIVYGASTNNLSFDRDMVDSPLATPNPELARTNDQTVIDYLARFDKASIAMQVRARLIEYLPEGRPHQETIAETLHISLRSLQRKLKDEDTGFKKLLEDTRRELAMQYIREAHRPIGEITYLLGFSEPSNFTRAFKRWTGKSPAQYRESA